MSFGYRDKFKDAREAALADVEDAPLVEDTNDQRPVQTTTAPVGEFTADVTPPSYSAHLEATAPAEDEDEAGAPDSTGEETPA